MRYIVDIGVLSRKAEFLCENCRIFRASLFIRMRCNKKDLIVNLLP